MYRNTEVIVPSFSKLYTVDLIVEPCGVVLLWYAEILSEDLSLV